MQDAQDVNEGSFVLVKAYRLLEAFRADPDRAVVEPDAGIESVSMADFEEWVGVALVPRT